MAYRDDTGDALEAPTAQGTLRVEVAPRQTKLVVGDSTLRIRPAVSTGSPRA